VTTVLLIALGLGLSPLAGQEVDLGLSPSGSQAVDTIPPPPEAIPGLLASDQGRTAAMTGIRHLAIERPEAEATLWTQLFALASAASSPASVLAAESLVGAVAEPDMDAGARIEARLGEFEADDRLPLLAFAALLSDRVDAARAAVLRARFVEESPDLLEGPAQGFEVRVRLARHLAGPGGDRAAAAEMLREVILAGASHPVAPEARRLLSEIGNPGDDS
jgi:hypothetical protein